MPSRSNDNSRSAERPTRIIRYVNDHSDRLRVVVSAQPSVFEEMEFDEDAVEMLIDEMTSLAHQRSADVLSARTSINSVDEAVVLEAYLRDHLTSFLQKYMQGSLSMFVRAGHATNLVIITLYSPTQIFHSMEVEDQSSLH